MSKYYDAEPEVNQMIDELIEERFSNLRAATIKVLMDSKLKVDKLTSMVTFASIKTTNEVEKFLSKDGHNLEGLDYLMFINDIVWEMAGEVDRKRLLSHELRHCFIDENGYFKTIRHDIEDFYAEIKLNEDDPMWGQALGTIVRAKYDQMKAEAKAARG